MQRHYKLRPSRLLTLLFVVVFLSSLWAIWVIPIPAWLSLVLSATVLAWSGYGFLHDARLRMRNSCVAFRLEEGESVMLVLRSGNHIPAHVLNATLVTPFFIVLCVMPDERKVSRNILVMPDTMSAESFRRLRVVLRWGYSKASEAPV